MSFSVYSEFIVTVDSVVLVVATLSYKLCLYCLRTAEEGLEYVFIDI